MRFLPRLATLSLLLVLPLAAGKRPFSIEDLYRLKGVGGLALSPDGTRLAFELSSTDLKAAKRNTDLWMLDLASGQLRQLTHTPGSERAARWTADAMIRCELMMPANDIQVRDRRSMMRA